MLFELDDVVVIIDVIYYCVKFCGVMDVISVIIMIVLGGIFKFNFVMCVEFLYGLC